MLWTPVGWIALGRHPIDTPTHWRPVFFPVDLDQLDQVTRYSSGWYSDQWQSLVELIVGIASSEYHQGHEKTLNMKSTKLLTISKMGVDGCTLQQKLILPFYGNPPTPNLQPPTLTTSGENQEIIGTACCWALRRTHGHATQLCDAPHPKRGATQQRTMGPPMVGDERWVVGAPQESLSWWT